MHTMQEAKVWAVHECTCEDQTERAYVSEFVRYT